MFSIRDFIKRNASIIMHVLVTFAICLILNLFFERFPDYLFFGNLVLSLVGVYLFYRVIFKKDNSNSILKLICVLSMVISANGFYSYSQLITVFPQLVNINRYWFIAGLSGFLILLLLACKLLAYLEPSNYPRATNSETHREGNAVAASENGPSASKRDIYSFLRFFIIIFILCVMIPIPALLLYLFNKHDLDKSALDFDKVFSFLLSYGSSFLLILFAVAITVITSICIIKLAYHQIRSFAISNQNESGTLPTYSLSVIVVCVLLFLSWRITDFSLDDFTQTLASGNYLALPLAVIVIVVLFFLLVQIVHAVIIMLRKVSSEDIVNFFKKQEKTLKIGSRVVGIIESMVDIILNTILSTLEFVKFVPNFFVSLSKMVLFENDEEESSEGEEEESTSADENSK